MARDEEQAMTSERLAHWHWVIAKHNEPQSMKSVVIDVRDLTAFVAEVERLRAENAELRAIASCLPVMFQAFQERHNEKASGGDGA